MKRKILSLMLAVVLVLSFNLVTAVPVAAGVGPAVPDREAAILEVADRLVATQSDDGGFDWVWDDDLADPSGTNVLGITAIGILKAYELEAKTEYQTALAEAYGFAKLNAGRYVYPDVTFLVWLADAAEADASLLAAIVAEVPATTIQDIRTLAQSIWDTRMAGGPYGTDGLNLDAAGRAVEELKARDTANYAGLGFWDLEAAVKAALALENPTDANAIAGVMYANLDPASTYYFDITDTSTICYVLALSGTIEAFLEVGVYPTMARTMTDELIAFQDETGYWDEVADPMWYESVQSTAYAVMALIAQGDADAVTSAVKGSNWLVNTQDVLGGWDPCEKDWPVENLEVDSEAAWALATAEAPVTIGVDGYYSIQAAIDSAAADDIIAVAAGTYDPFTVDTKTGLTIQSDGVVTVQGMQSVTTAYTDRDCVVFVKNSTNIVLDDLDIQGQNLGTINTKNYGVIYENSSGEINGCKVSPNTIGDMSSIAIGIWDGSTVKVDTCLIGYFGRVGMLIYNACTVEVLGSRIKGQAYSGEGEVCYGIEVEGEFGTADLSSASQVIIRGNEIYNCDNTFETGPTWQSGGVYINGWLESMAEADSTVIVEDNDIHDNYSGIIVIKSPTSYAHTNNIYDNRDCGVDNLPAYDASTAVFDATDNWWGHSSGPIHVDTNPLGTGDAVSDNVEFEPWLLEIDGPTFDMTRSLPVGWSLVSPDGAITLGVIVDSELEYEYTGVAFTTELSAPSPLKAIYVKTISGGGVGINYTVVEPGVIYSKDLVAGWNLISIPSTTATTQAILAQMRYVTIGTQQGIGLTTLVSEGDYNQNSEDFYLPTLTDDDFNALPALSPLDGYWVHLEADETFEVIPQ